MTPENREKQAIKQYLRIKGLFFYHNLAGLGVYPGIPDITAIDLTGKIFQIEVKAKSGIQSDCQKKFQNMWEANGGTYILGGIDEVMKVIK